MYFYPPLEGNVEQSQRQQLFKEEFDESGKQISEAEVKMGDRKSPREKWLQLEKPSANEQ